MDGIILTIEFLKNHWIDVITTVIFIAGMMALWVKGYKKEVKKIVLDLVVKAEKELGSGSGPLKYIRVTRLIYSKMPWVIKVFVTDIELDSWIEEAVVKLKEYLKDEKLLLSYAEEKTI